MRTEARFPSVEKAAGHYESFYIKACRPGGGLGLWLRHTVHKRPGHDPKGSIWFVLFDAEAEGPLAGKVTVDAAEVSAGEGAYIRIADAVLEDGRASGAIACPTVDASWDLSFEPRSEAYFHLPREWMYKAPLPKTKLLSPYPDALYSGTLRVKPAGGEEREVGLDRWPGMVGHNWGSEHAERWIWMNGAGFEGHEGWFDAALGRIKVGPMTSPWVGNAQLVLDGETHRLGGPERIRQTKVDETPTGCEFALTGKGIKVKGSVSAPAKDFVGWVYADPDGPEHNTVNCSISDMELSVERKGHDPVTLALKGAAAYELGMRETDHGIPLQPYGDG